VGELVSPAGRQEHRVIGTELDLAFTPAQSDLTSDSEIHLVVWTHVSLTLARVFQLERPPLALDARLQPGDTDHEVRAVFGVRQDARDRSSLYVPRPHGYRRQ